MSVLNDCLKKMVNAEKSGKRQVNIISLYFPHSLSVQAHEKWTFCIQKNGSWKPCDFHLDEMQEISEIFWLWKLHFAKMKKSISLNFQKYAWFFVRVAGKYLDPFSHHPNFLCRFSSDQFQRSSSSSSERCNNMDTSTNSRSSMMPETAKSLLTSTEDWTSAVSSHQDSISSSRTSKSSSPKFFHQDNSDTSSSPPTRVFLITRKPEDNKLEERSLVSSTETFCKNLKIAFT